MLTVLKVNLQRTWQHPWWNIPRYPQSACILNTIDTSVKTKHSCTLVSESHSRRSPYPVYSVPISSIFSYKTCAFLLYIYFFKEVLNISFRRSQQFILLASPNILRCSFPFYSGYSIYPKSGPELLTSLLWNQQISGMQVWRTVKDIDTLLCKILQCAWIMNRICH